MIEENMQKIRFTKVEGAQNDFLIIDDRSCLLSTEQRAAFALMSCHRRKSVGGDGVIFVVPSDENDFRMEFYNPDGSYGSMCGNGGRTAALWAYINGIAPVSMSFDVLGKTYQAEILEEGVRLYFPQPKEIRIRQQLEDVAGITVLHYAHTGAPHAVVFLDDMMPLQSLDTLNVELLGREIRHHPLFQPTGTNVNFIGIDASNKVSIRTYEKGVEAETEACGTGNLAAAIIAHMQRGLAPPVTLHTHGGDVLRVGFDPPLSIPFKSDGVIDPALFASNLYLEGPARIAFEGEIPVSMILDE